MALRLLSDDDNDSLLAAFPMLIDEEPFESPLLEYRAVSVWDHWLYLSGETRLIDDAASEERRRWVGMFERLDRLVLNGTRHVFVRWSANKLVVGIEDDIERACWSIRPGNSFVLLLPVLGLFYTSGDNDRHTRVTYRLKPSSAEPFDRWVQQSGLKYVHEQRSYGVPR